MRSVAPSKKKFPNAWQKNGAEIPCAAQQATGQAQQVVDDTVVGAPGTNRARRAEVIAAGARP